MINLREFGKLVNEISSKQLEAFGYLPKRIPEYKGSRSIYFRKRFDEDVNSFIIYNLLTWPSPQGIQIMFIKNKGELPLYSISDDDPNKNYWCFVSLPYLTKTVLEYSLKQIPQIGIWEFVTESELITQIQSITELIIKYAIPWIDNVRSYDPHSPEDYSTVN
jgi:hypothetical protein